MVSSIEANSFLNGVNSAFIGELYASYLDNPNSVTHDWKEFFDDLGDTAAELFEDMRGASWSPRETSVISDGTSTDTPSVDGEVFETSKPSSRDDILKSINTLMLIRAYRVRGHLQANLDPLGLQPLKYHPELDPKTYGFTEEDLDKEIFINNVLGLEKAKLRNILDILRETYCGNIGVEFMHMQDPDEKSWIQSRIESIRNHTAFNKDRKFDILHKLGIAQEFEHFLNKKFIGTKRFGIDGGESIILALEEFLFESAALGVQETVMGMAHRGRLNVLANIMGKSFRAIFSEFQGTPAHPDDFQGSGDVKYHLGTSADREFNNKMMHLSLTANPSHLEAVDTVVLGKVRAKQQQYEDSERSKITGILIHGDAAFAGQGIVAETLELSKLKGYETGGTAHFVINNQIGFTTSPDFSRSGDYCSDIAKMVQAPIFHVNGDDPEAVVHTAKIAAEFRHKFGKDVVVDVVCYRRFGHNEGDEPAFTQPLMYKKIKAHPTVFDIYKKQLADEKVIPLEESDSIIQNFRSRLEKDFQQASDYKNEKADWLEGKWSGLEIASGDERRGSTAVNLDFLKEVGDKLTEVPSHLNLHPKIIRQLKAKKENFDKGDNIDWATAESLAFGTLACEGTPVRLSGQDCGRGTFSQRHSVWVDQSNENKYVPLNNIRFGQAPYEVIDSPLSEMGVLGFEYGYSLAEPHMLVLWEAQFGDFANGAQVIIDQFVTSGESKWMRMCGLVMLLPHGYEGQGPEHSSARLERFLQACADDNIQVANCTTPANYFHILRRQIHRNFRKPLIIMTPKSLLRHKLCLSKLEDMAEGTSFHRVLFDPSRDKLAKDKDIKKVVLCSGKVFYDLYQEREEKKIKDVHIYRLEQLYPYPNKTLEAELKRFPNAEVVWCQEEPQNMGAWHFISFKIADTLAKIKSKQVLPTYVGRSESASPATGVASVHAKEQNDLVKEALTVKKTK